jgi:AcrR family transcriptional regulator
MCEERASGKCRDMRTQRAEPVLGHRPGTRGAETVERALSVVTQILDEGGEAHLRLADVSRRSSVSIGSLYHHFESREGLIRAARERQFIESIPDNALEEAEFLAAATSADDFLDRLVDSLRASSTPERAAARRRRLELLGVAASRPESLAIVSDALSKYLDVLDSIALQLEDRGWLRKGVRPRALSMFLHMSSMGRVIWEMDQRGADDEAWIQMIATAAGCLLQVDGDPIHYVELHPVATTNPPV